MKVTHPLNPIYDKNSKVLILGSIPSIKSRELGFYYGHPNNRFWKILERVYNEEIPTDKKGKISFLKSHHIALFDVLKSCEINSSSDSSIKNPVPNDLKKIMEETNIKTVFTTGRKAYQLYQQYCYKMTNIKAIYLPSTSPANCKKGIEQELEKAYMIIKDYTN